MSASSQSGGSGSQQEQGPPYLPQVAMLGGVPTVSVDDPICAVLLLLFVAGAVTNMAIFQINRRREHKFVFSALVFGFCMARITAVTMRVVWASRPTNIRIAIAANILAVAGVLILFIVNLLFAQRILRAYHPHFGWNRAVSLAFHFSLFMIPALLVMVITVTVQSFYTLDVNTHRIDRDIQLFAGTYLAFLAFLPIPIVVLAWLSPRPTRVEKFGSGRFRTKVRLVLFTSGLLALGAGFRTGVNFSAPRPPTDPAWYHSKACFYCFNFAIELIVVYIYTVVRFDRRFHVPDGSSAPGHYAGGGLHKQPGLANRVNREEDVFGDREGDDDLGPEGRPSNREDERAWEERARKELAEEAVPA